jgi:hypothetical protein
MAEAQSNYIISLATSIVCFTVETESEQCDFLFGCSGWDEARALNIERHSKYGKYKEAAHMACSIDPISQPSLDISPIQIPIISNEVNSSQRKSI